MLDTGAGFLSLDDSLAAALGLTDSVSGQTVDVATRPLPRLSLGATTSDQVAPVLIFDSAMLARATNRNIMGLIGYRVIRDRVLWLDYQNELLALVPAGPNVEAEDAQAIADSRRLLQSVVSPEAIPARFRMAGDGKVLVTARITPMHGGGTTPWLTLVLDTGASKCVLFEDMVEPLADVSRWRPEVRGLRAPTLHGVSAARLSLARRVELRGAARTAVTERVELALVRSPLSRQLGQLAGEAVHGLLGYSLLERYRIACDYPRRVLWLDPVRGVRFDPAASRGHVGIQLERVGDRVLVVAVAEGSSAEHAGIRSGDELVQLDGRLVSGSSSMELARKLDGSPGTTLSLTLRRGDIEKTYRLQRRRLF